MGIQLFRRICLIFVFAFSQMAMAKTASKKATKKVTQITFTQAETSNKTRNIASIDRGPKPRKPGPKKVVGINYDEQNPDAFEFDPVKPTKPKKKQLKLMSKMPEKQPLPPDPSLMNPIVIGSTVPMEVKKTDEEILATFQKSFNADLDDEIFDD